MEKKEHSQILVKHTVDNHVIPDKDPTSALGLGPGDGPRAPAYSAHLPTEPLLPSETGFDGRGSHAAQPSTVGRT